jgi:ornithine cyclodeaminase/alanine dehydrogenase
MTIIGCGIQGRAHAEALLRVRKITKVFAFDTDPAAVAHFAQHLGIEVVSSDSLENAVAESDIIITCTPARTPILGIEHRHPGLFIGAVGADNPEKNELAPALLAESRVVPDILDQAAIMGDLHHAIAAGAMTRDDIHGELADILCGRIPGRRSDDEVFIFDSTGTALQDVATASIALTRAIERSIGIELEFTPSA